MSEQVVGMYMIEPSERAEEAREALAAALPDATVGPADDTGIFEIRLDASDQEEALERVWDAIAAAGADDHITFAEHPELPEHWRARRR